MLLGSAAEPWSGRVRGIGEAPRRGERGCKRGSPRAGGRLPSTLESSGGSAPAVCLVPGGARRLPAGPRRFRPTAPHRSRAGA